MHALLLVEYDSDLILPQGIFDHGKKDLRHLNGIIDRMVADKLVSKLSIDHEGKTQAVIYIPYIQLVEKEEDDSDEDEDDQSMSSSVWLVKLAVG